MTTKICSRCKHDQPIERFSKDRSRRDGYSYHCHDCRYGISHDVYLSKIPDGKQGRRFRDNPGNFDRKKHAKQYRQNDLPRNAEYAARRRAQKGKATPTWAKAEMVLIRGMYREAKSLTEDTGVEYHVDHIVPLQSPHVCGLHCLSNLQILEGEDNVRKNNSFEIL